MDAMKTADLIVGVKAEQTLRDALRTAVEQGDDPGGLELVPFGKKDWIVGKRIGSSVLFGELGAIIRAVLKQLLTLESFQRIRGESVRVFSIQPPVPVFADFETTNLRETPETRAEEPVKETEPEGSTECPICKRAVHKYNLLHDPKGRILGCYICRGEPVF